MENIKTMTELNTAVKNGEISALDAINKAYEIGKSEHKGCACTELENCYGAYKRCMECGELHSAFKKN